MQRNTSDDIGSTVVFYVDDQHRNVLLMQSLFDRRPQWRLVAATTGRHAWRLSASLQPALLLLDSRLHDCRASKLLLLLRRRPGWADVPAVALSADDDGAGADSDFNEVWAKPLDLVFVLSRLDELLASACAAGAALRAQPPRLRRRGEALAAAAALR